MGKDTQDQAGSHASLARLGELYGVEPAYASLDGVTHPTSQATLQALLKAMGVPTASPQQIAEALAAAEDAPWRPGLAPLATVTVGALPHALPLTLPHPRPFRWTLECLSPVGLPPKTPPPGPWQGEITDPLVLEHREHSKSGVRLAVPLPPELPLGDYQFTATVAEDDGGETEYQGGLAVCPPACWRPAELTMDGRGVVFQLALWGLRGEGDFGVGHFGLLAEAARWAKQQLGACLVGVGPLHGVFNRFPHHISPYYPSSRLYLNPVYLHLDALPEVQASKAAQAKLADPAFRARRQALEQASRADPQASWNLKEDVLWAAFQAFYQTAWQAGGDPASPPKKHNKTQPKGLQHRAEELAAFVRGEGKPLEDFARFCVLEEQAFQRQGHPVPWWDWPETSPASPQVESFGQDNPRVLFFQYLQFACREQLAQAGAGGWGNPHQAGLYLDLALGVDPAGADGWTEQTLLTRQAAAGAPPDPLGPLGQCWGLAPEVPWRAKDSGWAYFRRVLARAAAPAAALRVDHIIRYWHLFWVPQPGSAAQGAYVKEDTETLFRLLALESHRHQTLIIGEDLGTVPPPLRETMARYGVLSTRLVMFEREGDTFRPAQQYPQEALAAFGTHDLPPLAGWWRGGDLEAWVTAGHMPQASLAAAMAQRRQDTRRLLARLKNPTAESHLPNDLPEDLPENMAENMAEQLAAFLAQTPCRLVTVNQEEWTLDRRQQNLPGTTVEHPNWTARMEAPLEALAAQPATAARLAALRQALAPVFPSAQVSEPTRGEPAGSSSPGKRKSKGLPHPANTNASEWNWLLDHAHADPHRILGLRPLTKGGWGVWAWRPRAQACRWIPEHGAESQTLTLERIHPAGVFFAALPPGTEPGPYRLETQYPGGYLESQADPYAFWPQLDPAWLAAFAREPQTNAHRWLGAHPLTVQGTPGVRFALWAPHAQGVSVVGNFNHWTAGEHPMRKLEGGVWELFVPGLAPGELYKYRVKPWGGPPADKTDPYAFQAENRPHTACVVAAPNRFAWQDGAWMEARRSTDWLARPVSVYECHPGSWRRGEGGRFLTWDELAEQIIPYLVETGFTHLELLPVMEHPLDESWGYQVMNLFAPTSRFGPPDGLRRLIDQCHQAGIGVILDWVPGHFPKDPHGLALFDGTPLYHPADPRRGEHQEWGTHLFDWGRPQVDSLLLSSALYWLEAFHADGLRVDAVASMLYLDYNRKPGEWIPNIYGGNQNLEAVAFLRRYNQETHGQFPGTFTVAEESTAWGGVSRPVDWGGLGFTMKWNLGWMHDTLDFMAKDPVHRRHHLNEFLFSLLYAWHENFMLALSHDEVVHGKGSLWNRMPGDEWRKAANLRLLLAYMWGHPGKKLLFMGQEFGQQGEWNSGAALEWHLLNDPRHAGVRQLIGDLNRLLRAEPALYQQDFVPQGFEWMDCHDAENTAVFFLRWDAPRRRPVLFACNLTPVPRMDYRVGVPWGGTWLERLNTDASPYGGSGLGNYGQATAEPVPWHGRPASLRLTLPPLAVVVFTPESLP
ncbi:MAG: 1,4-alpha-glucan branching protein GlgB [Deltaproteobacteria bacterium]|nr:1,4-alpha-glucan branching protein GlgB [Deltaproteobacteria bacterium]